MADNTDKLIKVFAKTAGNIATVVGVALYPESLLMKCAIGPVVSEIADDVAHRMLSQSENNKLSFVGKQIVTKIQRRLDNGEQPRRDDDFYVRDEYGQSSASKLLEETLLKCKQEYEAKKLESYSNFWENICFENGVSYEAANSLLSQFSSLNYLQIKILVYLNSGVSISIGKWEKYMFSNETLAPYYTIYSECLHLYNIRLAAQQETSEGGIQIGTPDICISPSGKQMCKLLDLTLNDQESNEMSSLIKNIDGIVERLMHESGDDGSGRRIATPTESEVNRMLEKQKAEIIKEAKPKWEVVDEIVTMK